MRRFVALAVATLLVAADAGAITVALRMPVAPSYERAIRAVGWRLDACRDEALAISPSASGAIAYTLAVARNGEVASVAIEASEGIPPAATDCFARVLGSIVSVGDGPQSVSGVIVLPPSSGAGTAARPLKIFPAFRAVNAPPLVVRGAPPTGDARAVRAAIRAVEACSDEANGPFGALAFELLFDAEGTIVAADARGETDGDASLAACAIAHVPVQAPTADVHATRLRLRVVREKGRVRVE